MPTAKQIKGTYSNKLATRKGRQNRQRAMREGKIRKLRKDVGLPHFGSEKQKLEQRNQLMKQRIKQAIDMDVDDLQTEGNRNSTSMENMVQQAQMRQEQYEKNLKVQNDEFQTQSMKEDRAAQQTRRAFFHQLKEVINRSDVIIIVLDARDPMGCRSKLIEHKILEKDPNKRIILLINKIDLVPKNIALTWLSLLRQEYPTILFKASTQSQRSHLGRNDMNIRNASSSVMASNVCLGADSLLQLLKNYCRSNGMKTSITVGIIGYPNVGKSSLINSLKRSRAVGVSATAGFTRSIQEIQIDRNISLLDCPGIIFNSNNSSYLLRNCVDVHELEDPEGTVEKMMQSLSRNTQYLQSFYQIPQFSNVHELLAYVARARGKLKKGGVPDMRAAACVIINDFNSGMIPFYVRPPQRLLAAKSEGLQIVNSFADNFDMNSIQNDNVNVIRDVGTMYDDDKYLVLDAEEDEAEVEDIPLLDRHLYSKRDLEEGPRIPSKEEILDQRQEMLQEEIMRRNEEQAAEQEEGMEEDMYDYSNAYFQ